MRRAISCSLGVLLTAGVYSAGGIVAFADATNGDPAHTIVGPIRPWFRYAMKKAI
jgi:hypothetical protein